MTPTFPLALVVTWPSSTLSSPHPACSSLPPHHHQVGVMPPTEPYQEQNELGKRIKPRCINHHLHSARQQGNHSHDAWVPHCDPHRPHRLQAICKVITTKRAAVGPCHRPGHRARRCIRSEQCVIREVAARAASFTETRVPRQGRNLYPLPTNKRSVLKIRQPSPLSSLDMNKVGEAVAYMMDTGPPSSPCDDITL